MVKKIFILISFLVFVGLASGYNECENKINKYSNWTLLYNKNKERIDSISRCVFGNVNKRVLELYDFNNSENYATLYIGGTIDEYVEFLKTIGSAESSPVTRDACRNLH